MKKLIFIFITFSICYAQSNILQRDNSTLTSKLLYASINANDELIVNSTYMIFCPKISSKGSGFLIKDGPIITNAHVVKNESIANIYAQSSFGVIINFERVIVDTVLDLAALITRKPLPPGGLDLEEVSDLKVGDTVETWGFPLGYNGPPPILCIGSFSGYSAYKFKSQSIIRNVVNAAFNSGNSGGSLVKKNSNKVIGVVVTKELPTYSPFVTEALRAFNENKSGFMYNGTNERGDSVSYTESKLVAEIVNNLREMYQVVIGEAITLADLKSFLLVNSLIKK